MPEIMALFTRPSSTFLRHITLHTTESTSPNPTSSPADCSNLMQNTDEGVQTREEHFSSGLMLLAALCSSPYIHWNDAEKHHYIDSLDDSGPSKRFVRSGFQDSDNSEEYASKDTYQAAHPRISSLEEEASASSDRIEAYVPSSPTLYSISSPATTHVDFFSTPPRSSTIATSPPLSPFGQLVSNETSTLDIGPTPTYICHNRQKPRSMTPNSVEKSFEIIPVSPLRAPNFVSLENAMNLSPLSSLMSSPLNFADVESPFHRGLSASTSIPALASHQDISDTASLGSEPAPKGRRRRTSPSSLTSPIRSRNFQCALNSPLTDSPKTEKRPVFEKRRRIRKHATAPETTAKARNTQKRNTAANKENSPHESFFPAQMSKDNLDSLAMTGFLVETLALSRASAMVPSELLRAVLKSQPHLREEHSEDKWLDIVQQILHGVEMFGRIKREGLDAADRPLEDEWFYIPENDKDHGRADLLKGLMPKKRAVTKQSKQYYFEPIGKLTRWDPESD